MIIGAHVSISGGIENSVTNAINVGCETFQVFTKNQTQWKEKTYTNTEIQNFKNRLINSSIKENSIASHDSYLINLCSNNKFNLEKSRQSFLQEINRCTSLGIPFLIFHPGSHMGKGEDWGLKSIIESLRWGIEHSAKSEVMLLLETTAGQGTNLGYRFEQLQYILKELKNDKRVGVCVDTCHIYAAGYDIRDESSYHNTMNRIESVIGLKNLKAFHLNDSKKEFATRVDRHERIGKGAIGEKAFRMIMNDERFKDIPAFLEVPGGDAAYKEDITLLKSMRK